MNRCIYSINPSVGQFIPLVVSAIGDRYIGITRSGGQQDLLGLSVDRHNNIDIRSRNRSDWTVSINPTDIDVKGVRIRIRLSFGFNLTANLVRVNFLQFFRIVSIHTCNGIFKGTIQGNGFCLVFL